MSSGDAKQQHSPKAARQQRLKQALRANLKRRKSQLKARDAAATERPAERQDSGRGD